MVGTSGEKMCASITRTEIGRMEEKRQLRDKFRNVLFLECGWTSLIRNVRNVSKPVNRQKEWRNDL